MLCRSIIYRQLSGKAAGPPLTSAKVPLVNLYSGHVCDAKAPTPDSHLLKEVNAVGVTVSTLLPGLLPLKSGVEIYRRDVAFGVSDA